jgi:hypothetical protein
MNIKEKERMAVMENEISHIKKDVTELKAATEKNFQEIKSILIKRDAFCIEQQKRDKEAFAGKWVEKVIIGIIGAVGAAAVIAAMTLI